MAYIKKLKDNELIGGTDNTDVYPVTSTEAVYNKENVSQEYINNHVDGSKIVDGTVTNSKIANGAVSMNKLDNETQTLIQRGADSSWTPKGDFNIETTYDANDVVFDPVTNSSYLSLRADNTGHPVDENDEEYEEGWWMKVLDGSYVNRAIEEMEAAIAQAIEDAQEDISELISDSQATINAAVSGANSAAQSANTAAANAEAKIDWVEEQVDSLTAYEVAPELDETSIIPVQNKVVSKEIHNANNYIKGDVRILAVGQAYDLDEAVKTVDGKMRRMTKEVRSLNLADAIAVGELKSYSNATYRALKAIVVYNNTTAYVEGNYAVGRPSVVTITVDVSGYVQAGEIALVIGNVTPDNIQVTAESTATTLAAAIVAAVGSIPGWTITDNEDGTITIQCNTAGANTLAFSFTDVDKTGVDVRAATVAGATTVSVYDGSTWSAATLAGMVADTTLFTSVDATWLASNAAVQNSIHYELSKIIDYTEVEVKFTDNKYYSGMWNKKVGDTVTFNTSREANNGVARLNCVEGEIFCISARVASAYNPAVCFISAENKILSLCRVTNALVDSIWVAPKGAVQLAIQSRPDVTRRVLRVGTLAELDRKVDKETYYKDFVLDKSEWLTSWTSGKYYPESQLPAHVGFVAFLASTSNNSYAIHQIVSCAEGDVFWVNLSTTLAAACCVFLDSENRVLAAEGKTVAGKYVVAPHGSVKVVFTGTRNSGSLIRTQRVHKMFNIRDIAQSYLDDKRINITFWQSGVYATFPKVGDVMNYTLTSSSVQFHQIIECEYNDCFYLKVSNNDSQLAGSSLIFVDVNDVVVWSAGKQTRKYQYYQAPKNAVKMICQTNVYEDLIYKVGKIDYNSQRLNTIVGRDETWRFYEHFGYLVGVVNTPIGEQVTDFTTLPDVTAYSRYALFECNAGDTITVDQGGGGSSWNITFLDSNNIVLDRVGNIGRRFSAVAPSNAVMVHVTAWVGLSGEVVSASCGGMFSEFDGRIQQLETGLDYPYDIVCPDVFYAVAGYQKNIYKDTIIRAMDDGLNSPMGLTIDFECPSFNHQGYTTVGIRRPRVWQLSGSNLNSHKGTFTFRINVFNQKGIRITYKDCTIKVVDATPLTENKNILCVGDSLTAGGQIVATCYSRFAALNGVTPTFWGSRTSTVGDVTVKHEGRSGWEWDSFTKSGSPFYIGGKVDITAYRNSLNMGEEKFDLVIFCLGVNNSVLSTGNGMSNARTLINAFLADNPDTKFILQLQPADNNTSDGWEVYAKDSLNNGIKEIYKNNTWNARQAALNTFNNETWAGKVYIGDAVMGLDRYYGYPYEEQASSNRISVTEIRHTNCVHPNAAGYNQLGDGYFYQALAILNGNA